MPSNSLVPASPLTCNVANLLIGGIIVISINFEPQKNIFGARWWWSKERDFWKEALDLGDVAHKYADTLLIKASHDFSDVSHKIQSFKDTVGSLVQNTASDVRQKVQERIEKRGVSSEEFFRRWVEGLEVVRAEIEIEFPPTDQAPGHEQRCLMFQSTLDKVGKHFVLLTVECGTSQDEAEEWWATLEGRTTSALVLAGDIIEQHPILLEIVLFAAATAILPEIHLLRPILRLFGFGPKGPIAGSLAAQAQRRFWGGAVAEGSWFSRLQSAAMKPSEGWLERIWKWIWDSFKRI